MQASEEICNQLITQKAELHCKIETNLFYASDQTENKTQLYQCKKRIWF